MWLAVSPPMVLIPDAWTQTNTAWLFVVPGNSATRVTKHSEKYLPLCSFQDNESIKLTCNKSKKGYDYYCNKYHLVTEPRFIRFFFSAAAFLLVTDERFMVPWAPSARDGAVIGP